MYLLGLVLTRALDVALPYLLGKEASVSMGSMPTVFTDVSHFLLPPALSRFLMLACIAVAVKVRGSTS